MITKDQIFNLTLEQITTGSKEREKDFKIIKELVQTALFSRFPIRREYFKSILKEKTIDIKTIKEDGILYVYIKSNDLPKYVFVGEYKEDDTVFSPRTLTTLASI